MGGRGWASCGFRATAAATCSSRVPAKRSDVEVEVGDADDCVGVLADDAEGVGDAEGFGEVVLADVAEGADAVVVALERDTGALLGFPRFAEGVELALVDLDAVLGG